MVAMKIYAVLDDEGHDGFLFTSRDEAVRFAQSDADVQEREVYESQPPTWFYWHRGAAVYPDGFVRDWVQEHSVRGAITIPSVDDHLNRCYEPWDGHTQGHCGEHVSVFGTDRDAVEHAYRAAVAAAVARQDGTCHSRFTDHVGDDIDGMNVYDAGFLMVRRRGVPEPFALGCYRHFDHDWVQSNEHVKHCRRCSASIVSMRPASPPPPPDTGGITKKGL